MEANLARLAQSALDRRALPVLVVGESFADLEGDDPLTIVDREAGGLAALLYAGGTTGRSKCGDQDRVPRWRRDARGSRR